MAKLYSTVAASHENSLGLLPGEETRPCALVEWVELSDKDLKEIETLFHSLEIVLDMSVTQKNLSQNQIKLINLG